MENKFDVLSIVGNDFDECYDMIFSVEMDK